MATFPGLRGAWDGCTEWNGRVGTLAAVGMSQLRGISGLVRDVRYVRVRWKVMGEKFGVAGVE